MTGRRGFLGLLGAGAASLPFVGRSLAMERTASGGLRIAEDIPAVELVPAPAVSTQYLVIPSNLIMGFNAMPLARHTIDVSDFGSMSVEMQSAGMWGQIRLDVRADQAFMEHAWKVFQGMIGR